MRLNAVFFAIQNVRARHELFEFLLRNKFGVAIEKHWNSCSKFLLTLATFRNAIAHWHPHTNLYTGRTGADFETRQALGHPAMVSPHAALEIEDFPPFLKDCMAIRTELSGLIGLVKDQPQSSRGKVLTMQSAKQKRQRALAKALRERKP